MEILAILAVKNSNVCLNHNKNTVPSITGCAGTCELNYKARVTQVRFPMAMHRTSLKVSLMVFNERES